MINCTVCHRPLANGPDTFGPIDTPMCLECHFALLAETEDAEAQELKDTRIMFNLMAGVYDRPEWFGATK